MNFEREIKNWVSLDNQIKQQTEKLKILKEERNETTETINRIIEDRNLHNATVEISDGRLRFSTTRIAQPLTFKYVEQCLGEIIRDSDQVEKIINYIKSKREIKFSPEIKRSYNN